MVKRKLTRPQRIAIWAIIVPVIMTLIGWFLFSSRENTTIQHISGDGQTIGGIQGDNNTVTQIQGADPQKYGEVNRELGETEGELEQTKNDKREAEKIVTAYKNEDKARRAILTRAENIKKTELIVKIFEEQDKGNISNEEALKISNMVNKVLWEDLKSFFEDRNLKIDEYNQSLVVSGVFKAKITGGGYRARYNPAKITYVPTPEGVRLYEIAHAEK